MEKEVYDKVELLRQANEAFKVMEIEHKKQMRKKQEETDLEKSTLQCQIHKLETVSWNAFCSEIIMFMKLLI